MTAETRPASTVFDTLSAPQQQVLAALAAGSSVSAAARLAGVHRATVHNWLNTEAFSTAFDTSRQDYVESLRDQLRQLSALALDTLHALLEDPNTPPSVRLRAALAVLQRPVFPKPGWTLPEPTGSPAHEQHLRDMAEIDADYQLSRKFDEILKADVRNGHTRIAAIARNAQCPCGSGLKHKRCCGPGAPAVLGRSA